MTELIAVLSTGKGTWTEVLRLVHAVEWDKVIFITDDFGKQNFKPEANHELIIINANESIEILIDRLKKELQERVTGMEVAVNFISGGGKEHMALFSALLKMGVGIRLVVHTPNGIKEI